MEKELVLLIEKTEELYRYICSEHHLLDSKISSFLLNNACCYIDCLQDFIEKSIKLSKLYSDIKHINNKGKEYFYTSEVNSIVDKFEVIHNVYCVPPQVELYIEVEGIRIYSEPYLYNINICDNDWDKKMLAAGIRYDFIKQIEDSFDIMSSVFDRR